MYISPEDIAFYGVLIAIVILCSGVNAEQFYWVVASPSAVAGGSYSSPSSACAVVFDYYKPTTNWIKSVEPVRRNDTVFDCFARGTNASGSAQSGNIGVISEEANRVSQGLNMIRLREL
ncbi:hypothetical protein [Pseudomonas aeruginosa]|uniref:hypothetical protein n=1 Tax=Pseudomonas aeruginosa TaxID=287 RepID=UPI000F4F8304|nr:hypothetical protein [Pseudomonas aeruginosa]